MTHIDSKTSIASVMIAWTDQSINLLRRCTGVDWTAEYKVDLWDAEIIFQQGEFKYQAQSMNFTDSIEDNFFMLLCGVIWATSRWRGLNVKNR